MAESSMEGSSEAERAIRKAIEDHNFSKTQTRILNCILELWFWYGTKPKGALVPGDWVFGKLCKMSKGLVSETLNFLIAAQVLQVELYRGVWKRTGYFYRVRPPVDWRRRLPSGSPGIAPRAEDSQELRDLKSWLAGLDPQQPDLLEPPASLTSLLIDDFLERAGQETDIAPLASSKVETEARQSFDGAAEPISCHPRQRVEVKVPDSGTLTAPTPKVPDSGTLTTYTRARAHRSIESSTGIDQEVLIDQTNRSIDRGKVPDSGTLPRGRADFQAYVEERLFRLIGQEERLGPMRKTWLQAVREFPEQVDAGCAECEALRREGLLRKTPVRFMNVRVRTALGLLDPKL
jgi:hypothetical protein